MIILEFSKMLNEISTSGDWGYMSPKAWHKDAESYRKMIDNVLHFYKGYTIAGRDDVNFKPIWGNSSCGVNDMLKESLGAQDYILLQKYIRQQIALLLYDLFKKRSIWV